MHVRISLLEQAVCTGSEVYGRIGEPEIALAWEIQTLYKGPVKQVSTTIKKWNENNKKK